MSYTYRKPKNAEEAVELAKLAKVAPKWCFLYEHQAIDKQKYFAMYEPILFIYKQDKLVAAAHNKLGSVKIYDIQDVDVTKNYTQEQLAEIDVNIKQIELF